MQHQDVWRQKAPSLSPFYPPPKLPKHRQVTLSCTTFSSLMQTNGHIPREFYYFVLKNEIVVVFQFHNLLSHLTIHWGHSSRSVDPYLTDFLYKCNIPQPGCISMYSTTLLMGCSGHFLVFFCNNSVSIITWAFPQDIESVHQQHFKWMCHIPYGYTRIYSAILLFSNPEIVSDNFFCYK